MKWIHLDRINRVIYPGYIEKQDKVMNNLSATILERTPGTMD
jgi:hypothetical protein